MSSQGPAEGPSEEELNELREMIKKIDGAIERMKKALEAEDPERVWEESGVVSHYAIRLARMLEEAGASGDTLYNHLKGMVGEKLKEASRMLEEASVHVEPPKKRLVFLFRARRLRFLPLLTARGM